MSDPSFKSDSSGNILHQVGLQPYCIILIHVQINQIVVYFCGFNTGHLLKDKASSIIIYMRVYRIDQSRSFLTVTQ